MKIQISSDKKDVDISYVHSFLTTTYWAKGRSFDEVKQTINASLCFALLLDGQQIGFARVVTDTVIFAYLMDVFVDPKFRGKGYGKLLIEAVMNHSDLTSIKKFFLQTNDAQGLYAKFGFAPLREPILMMEKLGEEVKP